MCTLLGVYYKSGLEGAQPAVTSDFGFFLMGASAPEIRL